MDIAELIEKLDNRQVPSDAEMDSLFNRNTDDDDPVMVKELHCNYNPSSKQSDTSGPNK